MTTRGIRNNNPGNIDKGQPWQGLSDVQSDERFCTFVSPEYGIRAIHIILQSYQREYKIRTISGIISRWAPPSENNTEAYIEHVSKLVDADPLARINVLEPATAYGIVCGIIAHENAGYKYEDAVVWAGLSAAGVVRP